MSNLVAIAYQDRATAEEVRRTLTQFRGPAIQLEDALVVTRGENGKTKLHQVGNQSTAGSGGASGAFWGGVIGFVLGGPLLGALVGGAAGAAGGALTDTGVDDEFAQELGSRLEAGEAALLLLVRHSTPEEVLPHIQQYGGHVLQTSLNAAAEARLREALGEATSQR